MIPRAAVGTLNGPLDFPALFGDASRIVTALQSWYPGGKNGAGVFQSIINRMPPHRVYIEPFLGSGAVMRAKRPAAVNIGVDLDRAALREFRRRPSSSALRVLPAVLNLVATSAPAVGPGLSLELGSSTWAWRPGRPGARSKLLPSTPAASGSGRAISGGKAGTVHLACADGVSFLRSYPFAGDELVYCDPPYMRQTRSGRGDLYRFEMDDAAHVELLAVLLVLPCFVVVSGYWSQLYADTLAGWQTATFQTTNRGGRRVTEWLWSNFLEPVALHDYRYLGRNFRERERIKRKKSRWVRRLRAMEVLERRALLAAIADAWAPGDLAAAAAIAVPGDAAR